MLVPDAATEAPPMAAPAISGGSPAKRACDDASAPLSNKKPKAADGAEGGAQTDEPCGSTTPPEDDGAGPAEKLVEQASAASLSSSQAEKPQLLGDVQPGMNDLVIDRELARSHPANQRYYDMIAEKEASFLLADELYKITIAAELVGKWRSQEPPGRILAQCKETGQWYDVGDEKAVEKTLVTLSQPALIKDEELSTNDIFLGQGGRYKNKPGNAKYRALVESRKILYQETKRSQRAAIINDIMQTLRSQDPPSRFLKREDQMGGWLEVDDDTVRSKLGTALRGKSAKKRDSNDSTGSGGDPSGIRPYVQGSSYNDVLSYFASTPFDADSMQSLRDHKQRTAVRACPVLPSRASLPIVSQRQFINKKTPALDVVVTDEESSLAPSPTVQNEVSKFLEEEAKHVITALPVEEKPTKPAVSNEPSPTAADMTEPTLASPKVAVASDKMADNQSAAKMPVAFGFDLDNDASKRLAQAAAENWLVLGGKAMKSKAKGRVSIGCKTPKASKKPGGSATPKTPRTPAVLISTKPAPGLPEGWVVKMFQRASGSTAGGTDKYFYSPQTETKFRSMKGCKTFVGILSEPGVDGNELEAKKLYKERGNKF
ncbi:hypothetical protein ACHAXT_009569 [Thalassiosira profunda]